MPRGISDLVLIMKTVFSQGHQQHSKLSHEMQLAKSWDEGEKQ